jgi:hypothetical protein
MNRRLDAWKEYLIVGRLSVEIERQNTPHRFGESDFEQVHCLHDLVLLTEIMLAHVPERERRGYAISAVRSAYSAVFPQISCPPLSDSLAGAFRPHWDNSDFWKMVW